MLWGLYKPTKKFMKIKKWSSQWTMQLHKEAWKKNLELQQGLNWTRDLAIPVWCSTNWAMKPLTLGAGQLWVHMFLWKRWVLMIYGINHIWTAEMKWKWRNDRHSERNLIWNCVEKPEKKIQDFSGGFKAQLVEHCTGIARSRVQTPLKSGIFFRLLYTIA